MSSNVLKIIHDENKVPSDNDNNVEVLRSKIRNYEELLAERDARIIKLEGFPEVKDSKKTIICLRSQIEDQDDSNSPPFCKK
ncbi:unnamed protein product [Rotaria magnacalcarata]